jgi:hypothetical protein
MKEKEYEMGKEMAMENLRQCLVVVHMCFMADDFNQPTITTRLFQPRPIILCSAVSASISSQELSRFISNGAQFAAIST